MYIRNFNLVRYGNELQGGERTDHLNSGRDGDILRRGVGTDYLGGVRKPMHHDWLEDAWGLAVRVIGCEYVLSTPI